MVLVMRLHRRAHRAGSGSAAAARCSSHASANVFGKVRVANGPRRSKVRWDREGRIITRTNEGGGAT